MQQGGLTRPPAHGVARRWTARVACALSVCAIATWFWARPRHPRPPASPSAPALAAPGGRGAPPRFAPPPSPRSAPPPRFGLAPAASPAAHHALASVYPPQSRPLDRAIHADLIDWNRRHDRARPVEGDEAVEILFTADRQWLIGADELRVRLVVRRAGRPIAVRVSGAHARFEAGRGPPLPASAARALPLVFERQGDAFVVARFAPAAASVGVDRPVRVRVEAEVSYEGGARPERVALLAHYTPAAAVPARFSGRFRDVVEEGSLVVYAAVEVARAGFYNVDANLWDAGGAPVAWARWKGSLAAGPAEIPLLFFGKVLRDAATSGPWRLGELRGLRYASDRSPAEELMPPFDGPFETRGHALSAFSPAPWHALRQDEVARGLAEDEARGLAPPIARP